MNQLPIIKGGAGMSAEKLAIVTMERVVWSLTSGSTFEPAAIGYRKDGVDELPAGAIASWERPGFLRWIVEYLDKYAASEVLAPTAIAVVTQRRINDPDQRLGWRWALVSAASTRSGASILYRYFAFTHPVGVRSWKNTATVTGDEALIARHHGAVNMTGRLVVVPDYSERTPPIVLRRR